MTSLPRTADRVRGGGYSGEGEGERDVTLGRAREAKGRDGF